MIVLSAKRWVRPDLLMLSLIEVAQRRMVMLGTDASSSAAEYGRAVTP